MHLINVIFRKWQLQYTRPLAKEFQTGYYIIHFHVISESCHFTISFLFYFFLVFLKNNIPFPSIDLLDWPSFYYIKLRIDNMKVLPFNFLKYSHYFYNSPVATESYQRALMILKWKAKVTFLWKKLHVHYVDSKSWMVALSC